jgi:hypothetical protein
MVTFFLSLFVMDWLRMTFVIFLIPIIWFYSMFDALQKTSQPTMSDQDDFVFADWLSKNHRVLAYLLIGLGVLLILNKFVFGFIMWQYNEYIQTAVVSLLLIAGGFKLLRGTKLEVNGGIIPEERQSDEEQPVLNEVAAQEEQCSPEQNAEAADNDMTDTELIPGAFNEEDEKNS